jgi:hypothetical protein
MSLNTAVPAFDASRAGRLNPMIVLRIVAIGVGLCLLFGPALADQVRLKAEVTVTPRC